MAGSGSLWPMGDMRHKSRWRGNAKGATRPVPRSRSGIGLARPARIDTGSATVHKWRARLKGESHPDEAHTGPDSRAEWATGNHLPALPFGDAAQLKGEGGLRAPRLFPIVRKASRFLDLGRGLPTESVPGTLCVIVSLVLA